MPTVKSINREEAERFISEYKKSGLTRQQFCENNGIKLVTFHWWMKRHNDAGKKKATTRPSFISVQPSRSQEDSVCNFTIDFPSGTRLKWHGSTLPDSFYLLLSYLGGTPS
jgi:hypothetical protein